MIVMVGQPEGATLMGRIRTFFQTIHVRDTLHDYESVIIIVLWVFALAAGFFGYLWALDSLDIPKSWIDIFYMTLQLFFTSYKLEVPPPNLLLEVARFLAPALMFSTLLYLLASHLCESYRRLTIRLSRGHVIICGLGLLGPVLVDRFCRNGYKVVVIEKDPSPVDTELCQSSGAFVLPGDASKPHVLAAAGISKAKYLITVAGEDDVNAEIAGVATTLQRKDPVHPLTCYLHIVDLDLYTMLKAAEFQNSSAPAFRLDIFNIYQTVGDTILDRPESFLAGVQDPQDVRLLVIGIGRLGESLIYHAAKRWKNQFGNTGRKLPVTLLDKNAEEREKILLLRYPAIIRYCDFSTISVDIASSEFTRCSFLESCPGEQPYSRIFICTGKPALGLSAGLVVHKQLQRKGIKNKGREIPIVIRTNQETGLSHYIGTLKKGGRVFSNLYAFSLRDETSSDNKILNAPREMIARAIHEDYVVKEKNLQKTPVTSPKMIPWDELPEDYRESNRLQADDIINKLHAISCRIVPPNTWDDPPFEFTPDEVEMLAEMEHMRWMNEKKDGGWKYGKTRVERRFYKRHPLLVPFKDLSPEDKEKDRNAIRLIPALLKNVDLKIIRL